MEASVVWHLVWAVLSLAGGAAVLEARHRLRALEEALLPDLLGIPAPPRVEGSRRARAQAYVEDRLSSSLGLSVRLASLSPGVSLGLLWPLTLAEVSAEPEVCIGTSRASSVVEVAQALRAGRAVTVRHQGVEQWELRGAP